MERHSMDAISLPADILHLAARLALATLLGAAIGLNREISLKPAGRRTHALHWIRHADPDDG
jgi:uncharacterized membrane protein YhiD involved in acid resistance